MPTACHRIARSRRRPWVSLCVALALALPIAGGCHHRLPRLTAAGQHDEVVARVARSKWEPKGKAARAYATSLEALDRVDEARAALQRDFRKRGDLTSLIALGDLEVRHGLFGVALARYARASTLDATALVGRADVCRLFQRRAARFLEQGEGLAADQDMRRAAHLCSPETLEARATPTVATSQPLAPIDTALWQRIHEAAEAQARAQRTLVCGGAECQPAGPTADELDKLLADARAVGPVAVRAAAAGGRQLPAGDIPRLLRAELDGALGPDLVTDDELRAWIGYTTREELEAALTGADVVTDAYSRLRINRLGINYRLPAKGESNANTRAAVMSRVLEGLAAERASAKGWRVHVLLSDMSSAQMELNTGLRQLADGSADVQGDGDAAASETSAQHEVVHSSHWAARVPVSARTLTELVVLARMRAAAGNEDQALEILRFALAEGRANNVPGLAALTVAEARRMLAEGHPWRAVAVVDAVPGTHATSIERAAGSAVALARVSCPDGACGVDEDRQLVERVMGEAWVRERAARMQEGALQRLVVRDPDACPTLHELLVGDASGALASALRAANEELDAPGVADALRRAVESDITLVCAGRVAVPLLVAGGYRATAEALDEELSHAPQMIAANQLALHGELALVAGASERGVLRARAAAAAASDPRAYWRRAQRFGNAVGDRDYEMVAIHEGLLHTPAEEANELRLELLVRAVRDVEEGWVVKNMEIGRETLARQVGDVLRGVAPAQRYAMRDALAERLAEHTWSGDGDSAAVVRQVLWSESDLPARHAVAFARLERALHGGDEAAQAAAFAALVKADPMAPGMVAMTMSPDAAELSPVTAMFCPVDELASPRLALARYARDPGQRRRAAIGVAVTGREPERLAALRVLVQELARAGEDARRGQVVDLLLAGLVALPTDRGPLEPIIADPDALLGIALNLEEARRRPAEEPASGGGGIVTDVTARP